MNNNPPAVTYNQRFEDNVRRFPERAAFRLKAPGGYRQVTYSEVSRQARGIAFGLLARGLERGMRVAILSENRPEWVITYLGIYLAGGTVVPLDAQISPEEWRRLLDDSESEFVFVSGSLMEKLRPALAGTALERNLVCFDETEDSGILGEFSAFIEQAHSLEAPPEMPGSRLSDVVVIIYTSGTTGKPKGVMLTQANIVASITSSLEAIQVNDTDSFLCLLPLQHVFASVVNFLLPIYVGATVTFVDTLKRSEILEALEEGKISILATVPQFFYLFRRRIEEELAKKPGIVRRIFRFLMRLNRLLINGFRLNLGKAFFGKIHRTFGSNLRMFVSGGSAFDPRVAQDFYDLGFTILQGYGLTETTGGCTITRIRGNVVGSVGTALPGSAIRIESPDEAGVGEVLVRGPVVMAGYYKNEAATAEVMRDDWFCTGDLGRLDPGGNLVITGRKKEVIVLPSGKNIYPDEIEAHYGQSTFIKEVAVIGVADPDSPEQGERLHGIVVPDFDVLKERKIANTREVLRDEIGAWSSRLPSYKRLMSYQIQKEDLPRTTTRKIKRLELKKLFESGQLRESEASGAGKGLKAEDAEFMSSAAAQAVVACLRETYGREETILPDMNLELDLGFDSMERVEFLASLEQSLGITLPEDFAAEIHTVRELIAGLEEEVKNPTGGSGQDRRSWSMILSPEALRQEGDWHVRFAGPAVSAFKFLGLKALWLIARVLLGLEARGKDNLPKAGSYLICPNHLSFIDPFVVICVLPFRVFRRLFFVGYSEFFQTWYMKLFARMANVIPVDPDVHLLRAMKVGAWGLRDGRILCIFPEGGRSFDGNLMEFRKGAAILAREVNVPMVPVGIHGAYQVWARNSRRIRLHKVKVVFGPPVFPSPSEEDVDLYQRDTDLLRDAVRALL